jgi:miniconductance mechanosensitive channel
VPALLAERAAPAVFEDFPTWIKVVESFAGVYIAVMVLITLFALLNAIADIMQEKPMLRDKPIRSYIQLLKIIFTVVTFIIIVAILIGRSPVYILGGFGAATAILALLFKDTLLGLVASVQMSAIDLVRTGDWISVEKYGADGEVLEINLTSIKVQNWDMTISIIPSYALINDSFKNWRGMQVSGGRRIKRHISIKISSIRFIDEKLFQKLLKVQLIQEYLHNRQNEIDSYNKENQVDKSNLINGRHMTNLGVFRVYAKNYLEKNPNINTSMAFMVRHLQPTDTGIPIEIYAFSSHKEWVAYETVMADIFDHLLAAIPEFELEVFESPTGQDFGKIAPAHA